MTFSIQIFLLLLAKKKKKKKNQKTLDNIKNVEHSICDKARGKKQGQISKDRLNLQSQIRYSSVLCAVLSLSVVSDSATPWIVALQAPLPWGFSRQEC